ncbi:hypothetical protein PGT21_013523 [Puccinia graminis f. sp. tritici]|uniref:Uncharacterized protein n=1 Tax=Puccinia graminis f. sp. tritici TaxID=56615 RepID=A0A5B0N5A1_PUCGR|nr:hypothetical protein PGTUg99_025820 [Puccinia graminis f. sp. tritici]KAA1094212.1 hypothetical protein PGT21_013523 [Puccinia graminis f. sp. tritici]
MIGDDDEDELSSKTQILIQHEDNHDKLASNVDLKENNMITEEDANPEENNMFDNEDFDGLFTNVKSDENISKTSAPLNCTK